MSKATEKFNPYLNPHKKFSKKWYRHEIKLTDAAKIYAPSIKTGPKTTEDVFLQDADGQVIYASARHNATNYEAVLKKASKDQGVYRVDDTQHGYAQLAAGEAIMDHLKESYIEKATKVNAAGNFFEMLRSMVNVTSNNKIKGAISKLFNSNDTFKRQSDGYRSREVATIEYLKSAGVSQEVIDNVKHLQSGQPSPNVAAQKLADLTDWEKSYILNLFKKAGALKHTKVK